MNFPSENTLSLGKKINSEPRESFSEFSRRLERREKREAVYDFLAYFGICSAVTALFLAGMIDLASSEQTKREQEKQKVREKVREKVLELISNKAKGNKEEEAIHRIIEETEKALKASNQL